MVYDSGSSAPTKNLTSESSRPRALCSACATATKFSTSGSCSQWIDPGCPSHFSRLHHCQRGFLRLAVLAAKDNYKEVSMVWMG